MWWAFLVAEDIVLEDRSRRPEMARQFSSRSFDKARTAQQRSRNFSIKHCATMLLCHYVHVAARKMARPVVQVPMRRRLGSPHRPSKTSAPNRPSRAREASPNRCVERRIPSQGDELHNALAAPPVVVLPGSGCCGVVRYPACERLFSQLGERSKVEGFGREREGHAQKG